MIPLETLEPVVGPVRRVGLDTLDRLEGLELEKILVHLGSMERLDGRVTNNNGRSGRPGLRGAPVRV